MKSTEMPCSDSMRLYTDNAISRKVVVKCSHFLLAHKIPFNISYYSKVMDCIL